MPRARLVGAGRAVWWRQGLPLALSRLRKSACTQQHSAISTQRRRQEQKVSSGCAVFRVAGLMICAFEQKAESLLSKMRLGGIFL
jgi:hypothetical protein